ncbi:MULTISPECIES: hypothetical protein [Agrobacterium]|uniref:Uncharacterized protein n=2 Tax=Agrobacterium TaxID=357 RepID=A0A4D7YTC1_AGRTU|nr:hypothetical protein [Agrobacterium tumefaciens]QCL96806.1 hypothetical protein CFBP7129_21835 [Agrobacterium tumefaciens]
MNQFWERLREWIAESGAVLSGFGTDYLLDEKEQGRNMPEAWSPEDAIVVNLFLSSKAGRQKDARPSSE